MILARDVTSKTVISSYLFGVAEQVKKSPPFEGGNFVFCSNKNASQQSVAPHLILWFNLTVTLLSKNQSW